MILEVELKIWRTHLDFQIVRANLDLIRIMAIDRVIG